MEEKADVMVKRAIVHILDPNIGMPVLSTVEHPSNTDIYEFLETHIQKIMKDPNLKPATFSDEAYEVKTAIEGIKEDVDYFVQGSSTLAKILYEIMLKHVTIPAADMVVCIFETMDESYLGILKCNYKYSYIHYTEDTEDGRINSILKQKTALPGNGQKIEEVAVINLNNMHIKLLEKEYELDGEKQYYFSQLFLKCHNRLSDLQKAKGLKKATELFNKKFCNHDIQLSDQFGKEVLKSIEETGEIDIPQISEKVFGNNHEMKDIYREHIEKSGFIEERVELDNEAVRKVFNKRKIKTDTGIEINLSLEDENNNLEFINHPDGTISIIIKNINSISYK
ncbi:nucleoid-associated protein [Alkaliphilus crotonatoxidans]